MRCFSFKPVVSSKLSGWDKQRFMLQLSTSESIITAFHWLEDGVYWRRRCEAQCPTSDVAGHGNSWKRMCVEQTIASQMEAFKPQESDMADLKELCEAVGRIVAMLSLQQLVSPTLMVPAGHALRSSSPLETSGQDTPVSDLSGSISPDCTTVGPLEIDMVSPANHLDFSVILPLFPNLEQLILCFQQKNCGVDFRSGLEIKTLNEHLAGGTCSG